MVTDDRHQPSSTKTIPSGNRAISQPVPPPTRGTAVQVPPPQQHDEKQHKHHKHHHKHVEFEKERERIVEVMTRKRDKPVSVSSKYPEALISLNAEQILGKGFFGTVYKGKDAVINTTFAIKSIDREVVVNGDKDDIDNIKSAFKREQRVSKSFCGCHSV